MTRLEDGIELVEEFINQSGANLLVRCCRIANIQLSLVRIVRRRLTGQIGAGVVWRGVLPGNRPRICP